MTDIKSMGNGSTMGNGSSVGTDHEVVTAPFDRAGTDTRTGSTSARTAVLLADDRAHHLNALEAILAPLAQRIIKVRTGEETRRHLLENDVAVVLLDVALPGLEGIATAPAPVASEVEPSKEMPIVVLTDFERLEPQRRGARGGDSWDPGCRRPARAGIRRGPAVEGSEPRRAPQ